MMQLFERDFDDLSPGQAFSTRGRTVTEADVVAFGTLTGDLHPQHVDAVWAAESPFGERIAHGMLVLSYAVGLVPLDPERVVALRRVRDVVFKRPVAIGDTIHVEGQVESLTPLDAATERAAGQLEVPADVLELDANSEDDVAQVAAELDSRWGGVDGVLHAIAFAPPDALGGGFLDTPAESAMTAFRTSAFSLKALGAG